MIASIFIDALQALGRHNGWQQSSRVVVLLLLYAANMLNVCCGQTACCNEPAPIVHMAGISEHIHQSGHPFLLGLCTCPAKMQSPWAGESGQTAQGA